MLLKCFEVDLGFFVDIKSLVGALRVVSGDVFKQLTLAKW